MRNATASKTGTIYARGLIMCVRIEVIAEGGDLNPWEKGLRPFAITRLCHLSLPLSLVNRIYLIIPFICFQGVEMGLAFSMGPLFPVLSYWGEVKS